MISTVFLLAVVVAAAPADQDKSGPDVRCGSFCLFVALRALDKGPETHAELEEDLGLPGLGGYSMRQLQEAAERFGAQTVAVETSLENLRHRRRGEAFACLTLIDSDHFVLLKDFEESQVSLIDPPRSFQLGVDTFRDVWTGKALLLGARPLRSEESVKWGRVARGCFLDSGSPRACSPSSRSPGRRLRGVAAPASDQWPRGPFSAGSPPRWRSLEVAMERAEPRIRPRPRKVG